MKYFDFFLAAILMAGCAPQSISTVQPRPTSPELDHIRAFHYLTDFFRLLNERNYAEAAPLYGGDYEGLQGWNPDLNPDDYATLWKRACEQNGLQCLQVRSAEVQHQEADTFVFQVEFSNPDGSLFVLGPCCGATETEMPPVSQFEITVKRNAEGRFLVMNMPPYVP